jgi:hypothetical protein
LSGPRRRRRSLARPSAQGPAEPADSTPTAPATASQLPPALIGTASVDTLIEDCPRVPPLQAGTASTSPGQVPRWVLRGLSYAMSIVTSDEQRL